MMVCALSGGTTTPVMRFEPTVGILI